MGKNQQHKQQQRSRHAGEGDDLPEGDTSVDVSFHTPEWHAARVAALTAERKTWEEWKLEQKEKAVAAAAVEDEEDRQNRSVSICYKELLMHVLRQACMYFPTAQSLYGEMH